MNYSKVLVYKVTTVQMFYSSDPPQLSPFHFFVTNTPNPPPTPSHTHIHILVPLTFVVWVHTVVSLYNRQCALQSPPTLSEPSDHLPHPST